MRETIRLRFGAPPLSETRGGGPRRAARAARVVWVLLGVLATAALLGASPAFAVASTPKDKQDAEAFAAEIKKEILEKKRFIEKREAVYRVAEARQKTEREVRAKQRLALRKATEERVAPAPKAPAVLSSPSGEGRMNWMAKGLAAGGVLLLAFGVYVALYMRKEAAQRKALRERRGQRLSGRVQRLVAGGDSQRGGTVPGSKRRPPVRLD